MTITSLAALFSAAALLLLAAPVAQAQTLLKPAPITPTNSRPPTLLKLGVGLGTNLGITNYYGTSVPTFLGLEHQLAPSWTLTANGSASWHLGRRSFPGYRSPLITQVGLDAGIRHYYHQEKRRQKGYRTGPYEGPYVALQTRTVFSPRYPNHQFQYDYTSLSAVWGVQRRLGGRGLLDAYLGAGVANPSVFRYDNSYQRQLGITLEVGVKLSLTNH